MDPEGIEALNLLPLVVFSNLTWMVASMVLIVMFVRPVLLAPKGEINLYEEFGVHVT